MRKFFYVILIIFSVSNVYANEGSARKENNTEHRLHKLEKDLHDLQVNIYQGDSIKKVKSSKVKYSSADLEIRVSELEELIRGIFGKIENLEFKVRNLQNSLDEQNDLLRNQNQRLENNPILKKEDTTDNINNEQTIELAPKTNKADKSQPINSPDQDYNDAYQMLRIGNTIEAEIAFTNFIDKYPENKLTSNAYYWLGEKYFAEGDYRQAAIKFLRGYEKFPDSNKAVDNLLKLSISLSSLNKNKEACTSFKKLFKEFPNANPAIVKRAEEEYKRLGCK